MHTTKTTFTALFLVCGLVMLAGCGKSAPGAPNFDPAAGKHTPADWATNHGTSFLSSEKQCQNCHGLDLLGGTSNVSCASTNQTCHPNLPHTKGYPTHFQADPLAGGRNRCSPCHGIDFTGGSKGPACSICHPAMNTINQISTKAPVRGECISCHGKTTGPNGNLFPNRSGAHQRHFSRANGNLSCQTCHFGGGSETENHGKQLSAAVAFPPNLSTPGQTARYDLSSTKKTCLNISCHGGKLTPGWGIGHLNVTADCESCHRNGKGNLTAPFNSYSSGKHSEHVGPRSHCTDCHLMSNTAAQSHFSNLTSHLLEQVPRTTLKPGLFNNVNQTCTTNCHGTINHSWR